MKRFIAYFDYLGYKDFILNNGSAHLKARAEHILRDIEIALAQGKNLEPKNGIILSDLSASRIDCLNISDTVIFWTQDNTIESLEELLLVACQFSYQETFHNIPVRGVIYFDEIEIISGKQTNTFGATYNVNLIYGKGLVLAHLKSERLNWAGCVIDQTVVEEIQLNIDLELFLEPYAKIYRVPYKLPEGFREEYSLKFFVDTINEDEFYNFREDIIKVFSGDNKSIHASSVQEKLQNTILYLETFRE